MCHTQAKHPLMMYQLQSILTNQHHIVDIPDTCGLSALCHAAIVTVQGGNQRPRLAALTESFTESHTRIRLGCSKLKSHLYYNLCVEDNPHYMCGYINEHPQHYFFQCQMFNRQRTIILTEIRKITQPTLKLLLHGDANVSLEENICVVLHVQTYLKDTHRFQRDVH